MFSTETATLIQLPSRICPKIGYYFKQSLHTAWRAAQNFSAQLKSCNNFAATSDHPGLPRVTVPSVSRNGVEHTENTK